jgi:hypothetical protein
MPLANIRFLLQILKTVAVGGTHYFVLIHVGCAVSRFAIGCIHVVAPVYISECAPKDIRGRITGPSQITVVLAVTIFYFIMFASSRYNQISYPS